MTHLSTENLKSTYHKPELRFYGKVSHLTHNTDSGNGNDNMSGPGTNRKTV